MIFLINMKIWPKIRLECQANDSGKDYRFITIKRDHKILHFCLLGLHWQIITQAKFYSQWQSFLNCFFQSMRYMYIWKNRPYYNLWFESGKNRNTFNSLECVFFHLLNIRLCVKLLFPRLNKSIFTLKQISFLCQSHYFVLNSNFFPDALIALPLHS